MWLLANDNKLMVVTVWLIIKLMAVWLTWSS
jgi:hypothetical protein